MSDKIIDWIVHIGFTLGYIFAIAWLLSGCSLQTPLPQLKDYSDRGVNEWAGEIENYWGVSSLRSDKVGTVGAVAAGTFSMAGFGTAAYGAPVAAPILTGMTAWILQMLGIAQPAAHSNAFDDGYNDIQVARGKYFQNMAGVAIPSKCITGYGAQFYQEVAEAIRLVSLQIKQVRVKDPPQQQGVGARAVQQGMNKCS